MADKRTQEQETTLAALEAQVASGVVDIAAPPDDEEVRKQHLAYLAELVTWQMPKMPTGDPIRIANEKSTWEFWPDSQYRTPRGVMLSALAQTGVHHGIEQETLKERGGMKYLGTVR